MKEENKELRVRLDRYARAKKDGEMVCEDEIHRSGSEWVSSSNDDLGATSMDSRGSVSSGEMVSPKGEADSSPTRAAAVMTEDTIHRSGFASSQSLDQVNTSNGDLNASSMESRGTTVSSGKAHSPKRKAASSPIRAAAVMTESKIHRSGQADSSISNTGAKSMDLRSTISSGKAVSPKRKAKSSPMRAAAVMFDSKINGSGFASSQSLNQVNTSNDDLDAKSMDSRSAVSVSVSVSSGKAVSPKRKAASSPMRAAAVMIESKVPRSGRALSQPLAHVKRSKDDPDPISSVKAVFPKRTAASSPMRAVAAIVDSKVHRSGCSSSQPLQARGSSNLDPKAMDSRSAISLSVSSGKELSPTRKAECSPTRAAVLIGNDSVKEHLKTQLQDIIDLKACHEKLVDLKKEGGTACNNNNEVEKEESKQRLYAEESFKRKLLELNKKVDVLFQSSQKWTQENKEPNPAHQLAPSESTKVSFCSH